MYKIDRLLALLAEYAPLEISYKAIERGDYDNSGLLVKNSENASKILFSLDLSDLAVDRAIESNADTIVTHHPAIYNPVKKLSIDGDNRALLRAIKAGLNVISMHLNLDMTSLGIDEYLARGLGGVKTKILDDLDGEHGYGREAELSVEKDAEQVLLDAKNTFKTDKILLYGNGKVKSIASFCGSGGDYAVEQVEKGKTSAQLIVTSDLPHHQLLPLIEAGKMVMIIPHYSSELYGFNKFYEWTVAQIGDLATLEFFEDKRFM